jgi:hypothetical protein
MKIDTLAIFGDLPFDADAAINALVTPFFCIRQRYCTATATATSRRL